MLLADVAKIKQKGHCSPADIGYRVLWASQYQKIIGRVVVVFKCNHVNITSAPSPLSIYPSKTTHKAIQMYQLTKEDLDSEEDKKLCIMTSELI